MKKLKIFNNKENYKLSNNKISLIKVNKKDNFNTSNIFFRKQKYKNKNSLNQSNDISTYIYPRINTDFILSNEMKSIRQKNNIQHNEIDIMKFQMSCNLINQKINQLRKYSKELESHSYDKIKNNINNTVNNSNIINNRNDYLKNNFNYLTYINNQQNINRRNNFCGINMNYTSNKLFNNSKLSFKDDNSINNINKSNINHNKKNSFTNYNNHINNINKINEINNIGINNNIIRKKNINKLLRQNITDMNIYNEFNRLNETERQLKNIPIIIKNEKIDNISINKRINYKHIKRDPNYKPPIYNKLFNNKNNIVHKRFNSFGINNISEINSQRQNININKNNNNNLINNENIQKINYYQKKNENKNKNRVGYFDNFFLKNKNLYYIENSCNYNIINQNSIEKSNKNIKNNTFEIEESSKISYIKSNNIISNNNINNSNNLIINKGKDFDKNINNKNYSINDKNNFIITNPNNFCLKGREKQIKNILQYNGNDIIKTINKTEIPEKEISYKEIKKEKNNEEKIIIKGKNIFNDNLEDSITERDDLIINSEKEIINKKTTEGKIISSDSEIEMEPENVKGLNNEKIVKINSPKNNIVNLDKEKLFKKEYKNEKEDSPSKSEDEIFNLLIEKVRQNKEISKKAKIEDKKKKINTKKVFFDNTLTNYILYDLNNPVTKIMIYDNKGKEKKFNPIKINEYIKKLKYSNISKNKKIKSNLINCPKINYKKIIEDSNKIINKTNKNLNKFKKIKISPNPNKINNKRSNYSKEWKKHIYSLCDDLIKSIDPLSAREIKINSNNKDKNILNLNIKKRRNSLINSYEYSLKKKNKSKERKNSIDLKRKKAKEKILNAIDNIRKYFEEIY